MPTLDAIAPKRTAEPIRSVSADSADWDDMLTAIVAALPGLPPELREEIVQDVAVLVLEGEINRASLKDGIREHLPALKRKYPCAQFQLSLDAPVNNKDGTTMKFADIVTKSGSQPKRRGDRKSLRPRLSAVCKYCDKRFYYKGRVWKLTKKQAARAVLLRQINPKFWTNEDIDIVRIAEPSLLSGKQRILKRKTYRTYQFCSVECRLACAKERKRQRLASQDPERVFVRGKRAGKPRLDSAEIVRLYVDEGWSTPTICRHLGASDPNTIRRRLLKAGVTMRSSGTRSGVCIEDNCGKPIHKIRHAGNGAMYGTRCKYHRRLHYAELGKWQTRKTRQIPPERWLYKTDEVRV